MIKEVGLLWYQVTGFDESKAIAAYERRMNHKPTTVHTAMDCESNKLTVVKDISLGKYYYFLTCQNNMVQ